MEKKNDGGTAYPYVGKDTVRGPHPFTGEETDIVVDMYAKGMSLRDHFAGLAMQGMLASVCDVEGRKACLDETMELGITMKEYFAKLAYNMADGMLKYREQ